MKIKLVICLLSFNILLIGCARNIQHTYWGAGTSVANQEEQRGNIQAAEAEYKGALLRAENHLSKEAVSDSLYNLGSFYRRQSRVFEAQKYLVKSLQLEETLTGQSSEKTGKKNG